MKRALFLAVIAAATSWAGATYTFHTSSYSTINNFTTCAVGPCASYTPAESITGSFTLAAPLGPNFSAATDITNQIIAYSLSDGINTFTNTNTASRIYGFQVGTDGAGNVNVVTINVELWQTGTSPHAIGNRVALIGLNGPSVNQGFNNYSCTAVGPGPNLVPDICQAAVLDPGSSNATANVIIFNPGFTPTTPATPAATPVPASLLLMLVGLAACGIYLATRRRFAH
jgi:hypothetical protein